MYYCFYKKNSNLSFPISRLYSLQKDLAVIRSTWIKEVLQKQCPVKDVPLKNHLLIPHFMAGLGLDAGNSVNTTSKSKAPPQKQVPVVVPPPPPPPGNKEQPPNPATTTYTEYNAVWTKLEQDCLDNQSHSKREKRHNKVTF